VLDGNRRWAKRNLVMQKQGHFKGADTVENLLDWCEEFDIKIKTLVSYHPAFLLRSPASKKEAWKDLQFLQKDMNNDTK